MSNLLKSAESKSPGDLDSAGIARLREVLDESAAGLDAATLSRLNRARQAALAARTSRHRYVVPIGLALAASLILAVVAVRLRPDAPPAAPLVHTDAPAPERVQVPAPLQAPAHTDAPALAHEAVSAPAPALAHQDAPSPPRAAAPVREATQSVAFDAAADLPDDDFASDIPGDEELAQEDLEFYAWLDAQEAQDG